MRLLETSLKNVSLLLSIGSLYANIGNHFLFEIVSSKERVSEKSGFKVTHSLYILNFPSPRLIPIPSEGRKLVAIYFKLILGENYYPILFHQWKKYQAEYF